MHFIMKAVFAVAVAALAGCGMMGSGSGGGKAVNVSLSGAEEVPPVSVPGSGRGSFTVAGDGSVSGSVSTTGVQGTMAHIHRGARGQNGPVVVNFNGQLSGSGFNDPDLANVIANPKDFYVNLHNADFPNGAIRGQIGDPLPAPVPLPAAMWLFGPGLLGLLGIAARKRRRDAWPDTPHPE